MSVAKRVDIGFFQICLSAEGINGLIVGVTTTRSEDSTCSIRHALYQCAKPNRPQGNPGLRHTHTQLCSCIWRNIHVTTILSQRCSMGFISGHLDDQSMTSTFCCAGWKVADRPTSSSVPCTQATMCPSPCRLQTRACSSVWYNLNLDRQMRYSVTSGECPKHEDKMSCPLTAALAMH